MFRRKFPISRSQAMAERVEQIRRLQQLRRLLAEAQSPVRQAIRELPGA